MHPPRRRLVLGAGAAIGATLIGTPARACDFALPHLRVTHPWTRATPAKAGSAVLCTRFDEVTEADRLVGLVTPVATGFEIVGPQGTRASSLEIPEGRETVLGEEGLRLRLVGLSQGLMIARAYPLTFVFERGGELIAALNVDYLPVG